MRRGRQDSRNQILSTVLDAFSQAEERKVGEAALPFQGLAASPPPLHRRSQRGGSVLLIR